MSIFDQYIWISLPWCAFLKWYSSFLFSTSKILIDLSADPETMYLLSFEILTEYIESMKEMSIFDQRIWISLLSCAFLKWYNSVLFPTSKILIELSSDPETMYLLSLEITTELTKSNKIGEYNWSKYLNKITLMCIVKMI